ncbi:BrnT family toxin [Marivita sp. S6314]|uniref:BrnT family toxin n=1 Tax=Marivita sp. S6314 TaxID=2926406 RepID=UPI001FF17997|nr:BrnT family toxin [Marivita sp. S6314]MCK0151849.1 BrnT family toxin [Marivita sp. S6314]
MKTYEWNDQKNRANIEKHGIDFETACRIFESPTVDVEDTRFAYGETRLISIGCIDNVAVLVVVHTDRYGTCWIISARKANKQERARYEQAIQESPDA